MGQVRIRRGVVALASATALIGMPGGAGAAGAGKPTSLVASGSGRDAAHARADQIAEALPAGSLAGTFESGSMHARRAPLTPPQVFAERGVPRTKTDLVRAERALLEAANHTKIANIRAQAEQARSQRTSAPAATAVSGLDSEYRFGLPAGDLDSDGRPDVLVSSFNVDTGALSIRAEKGSSGSMIWSKSLGVLYDAFVIDAGDTTGDGNDDFLVMRATETPTGGAVCDGLVVFACLFALDSRLQWDIAVVDGTDGSQVWNKVFPARYTELGALAFSLLSFDYVDAVRAENFLVDVAISDDVNGDGARDVLTSAWSATIFGAGGDAFVAFGGVGASDWASTLTAFDGADGSALFTRSTTGTATPEILLAGPRPASGAPHAVIVLTLGGDRIAVEACALLAGCTVIPVDAHPGDTLATYSATTGAKLAEANLDGILIAYNVIDDRTDGLDDVFVAVADPDFNFAVRALDGGTLATKWSRPLGFDDLGWLYARGTDGKTDLLWFAVPSAPTFVVTITRIDGATGTAGLTTTHSSPVPSDGFVLVGASAFGDADGDGADDFALDLITLHFGPTFTADSVVIEESGAAGAPLCSQATTDFSFAEAAGDVSGNGLADVVLDGSPTDGTATDLTAVNLADCSTVWTRSHDYSAYGFGFADVLPAGDPTGAGHGDLIDNQAALGFTPSGFELGSSVSMVDGATGTDRWSDGSL